MQLNSQKDSAGFRRQCMLSLICDCSSSSSFSSGDDRRPQYSAVHPMQMDLLRVTFWEAAWDGEQNSAESIALGSCQVTQKTSVTKATHQPWRADKPTRFKSVVKACNSSALLSTEKERAQNLLTQQNTNEQLHGCQVTSKIDQKKSYEKEEPKYRL